MHKNVVERQKFMHKNVANGKKFMHKNVVNGKKFMHKNVDMERKAYQELLKWKDNPRHKPLILNGARQGGKTWLLKNFGNKEYKNVEHIPVVSNIVSRWKILF